MSDSIGTFKSTCPTCGKPVIVRATRGAGSVSYCNKICASAKRYEKRYTGNRADLGKVPKRDL